MPRNGKIAHLPQHIREELNHRLEKGESGVQLVEWLNTLPEVKEVLQAHFDSRPINEVNLTEWKQGGFPEWQAQRDTAVDLRDFKAGATQLAEMTATVIDDIEAAVLAHYATTLHRSKGEITDQFRAQLQCFSKSLRDIVRYRRCEQARERTQIQRERLQLAQSKSQNRSSRPLVAPKSDEGGSAPAPTEEEKARALKEFIYPKHLFPKKYQEDANAGENSPPEDPSKIKPS